MSEQLRTIEMNSDGVKYGQVTEQDIIETKGEDLSTLVDDEKVHSAKEFLWKYVDGHNQKLLILMANGDALKKTGLNLKSINLGYQYNH